MISASRVEIDFRLSYVSLFKLYIKKKMNLEHLLILQYVQVKKIIDCPTAQCGILHYTKIVTYPII